jgi:hypothetical protein
LTPQDPEETIRYKVEIALPEVSVAEVEAADARMVQVPWLSQKTVDQK